MVKHAVNFGIISGMILFLAGSCQEDTISKESNEITMKEPVISSADSEVMNPASGSDSSDKKKQLNVPPQVYPEPVILPEPYPIDPDPIDPVQVIEPEPWLIVTMPDPVQTEPLSFAEVMPEFPGGNEALMKFIKENLKYPQYELELGIQGRVYIRFTVKASGELWDIKIMKSVPDAPNFDREAKRIIQSMPKWKPGENAGKKVDVYITLPITFKIDP